MADAGEAVAAPGAAAPVPPPPAPAPLAPAGLVRQRVREWELRAVEAEDDGGKKKAPSHQRVECPVAGCVQGTLLRSSAAEHFKSQHPEFEFVPAAKRTADVTRGIDTLFAKKPRTAPQVDVPQQDAAQPAGLGDAMDAKRELDHITALQLSKRSKSASMLTSAHQRTPVRSRCRLRRSIARRSHGAIG